MEKIKGEIERLNKDLERARKVRADAKANGNTSELAYADSDIARITEEINKLETQYEMLVNEEIERLKKDLERARKVRADAKAKGDTNELAYADSDIARIVERINKLQAQLPNKKNEYNKSKQQVQEQTKQSKNKYGYNWHPKLEDYQIDEMWEQGVIPGDEEYTRFLWDYGINPNSRESSNNQMQNEGSKLVPPVPPVVEGRGNGEPKPPVPPVVEGRGNGEPEPPVPPVVEGKTGEKNPKMPITSGLQVYRRVLNEIGYIKGTKAIKAYDWWKNHFGFGGRVISGAIGLVTGRKKEIKRIEGILDDLTTDNKGNTDYSMLDLMMDDFLTADGTKNIIKVKSNDIFLRALHNKLLRDAAERAPKYEQLSQQLYNEMKKRQEAKKTADPATLSTLENEIAMLAQSYHEAKSRGEHLNDTARLVEQGRRLKSLDYKNNIKGADEAVRDVDNREEINALADIDRKRLDAIEAGDKTAELNYMADMDTYMQSQTKYKKCTISGIKSIGAFEAPAGKLQIVSDKKYMFVKRAVALGRAGIVAAIAFARGVERMGNDSLQDRADLQRQLDEKQKLIDKQTADLNKAKQDVDALKDRVTGEDVNRIEPSLEKEALDTHFGTERNASIAGDFREGSSRYIEADAEGIRRTEEAIDRVQQYKNGRSENDPLGELADAFDFKAQQGRSRVPYLEKHGELVNSYYSDPKHLTTEAGVFHGKATELEGRAAEIEDANSELYTIAGNVFRGLKDLNVQSGQNISLGDIDLSVVMSACRDQGIDFFNVIAPLYLGTSHVMSQNTNERTEK